MITVLAVVLAVFDLVAGGWAFLAPAGFAASVATFLPFNAHFLHDAGAFQLGLFGALVAGLLMRRGLVVAFAANLVASVFHLAAHIEDGRLGGHGYDVPILALVAVLATAGFVLALRAARRESK